MTTETLPPLHVFLVKLLERDQAEGRITCDHCWTMIERGLRELQEGRPWWLRQAVGFASAEGHYEWPSQAYDLVMTL